MAVDIKVEIATAAHAEELAPHLRAEDVAEIRAADGTEPLPALLTSVDVSDEVWAVRFNGELALIFGVMPYDSKGGGRVGVAWMVPSAIIERHPAAFWRLSREMLPWLLERWDALINAIDVRHEKALRWAKRLGMKLDAPAPFGEAKLDFRSFIVTREDLACARP
jgi:hypothetical protein